MIRVYVVNEEVYKPISWLSDLELSALTNISLLHESSELYQNLEQACLKQLKQRLTLEANQTKRTVHEFLKTHEDSIPSKDLLVLLEVKHVHPEDKRALGV